MNKTLSEGGDRVLFIDCSKVIAMLLVSWGHFVSVGTWALDIPGVIANRLEHPLMPSETHALWRLESWVYGKTGVQFAVVGVVVFFLISGSFLPGLQQKYNRSSSSNLLLNRLQKLCPTTTLCVIAAGVLSYCSQRIKYPVSSYLATATITLSVVPVEATLGVIWYLMVLVFAYGIATVIPKIQSGQLTFIYIGLYLAVLSQRILEQTALGYSFLWLHASVCYVARYCGIVFLGAAFTVTKGEKPVWRVCRMGWFFAWTMLILRAARSLYGDESTYTILPTYIAAAMVILISCGAVRFFPGIAKRIRPVIRFLTGISLPFYLLHVHFGLTVIYYLQKINVKPWLCVAAAYGVSILAAMAVAKTAECLSRLGRKLLQKEKTKCM